MNFPLLEKINSRIYIYIYGYGYICPKNFPIIGMSR